MNGVLVPACLIAVWDADELQAFCDFLQGIACKVELINLTDVFSLRGIWGDDAVLYAVSVGQVSRFCHCQKISLNFIPFLSSKVQDSESTSTRFTANLNSYSSNSVSGFR